MTLESTYLLVLVQVHVEFSDGGDVIKIEGPPDETEKAREALENQAKERAGQAEAEEKKEEEKKEEAPKTEGRPVEADEETHTLGHTCHREEEEKKD